MNWFRHNTIAKCLRQSLLTALAMGLFHSQAYAADWNWNFFRRPDSDSQSTTQDQKRTSKLRQVRPKEDSRVSLIGGQPMRAKVHEYPETSSSTPQASKKNRLFGRKQAAEKNRDTSTAAKRTSSSSRFVMSGQPDAGGSPLGSAKQTKQPWWKKVFSTHVETTTRPVGVRSDAH